MTTLRARIRILKTTIAFVSFTCVIVTNISHDEYGLGNTIHLIVVLIFAFVCNANIKKTNDDPMYCIPYAIFIM